MKTTIASMAIALLFAVTANADVIHTTDFEADGTAQGTGFGFGPESMDDSNGGGDHVGINGQGLSDASGSFSYAVDVGNTADNGDGWGATWSTINSDSGLTSGGFGVEDDVIAAGSGKYIEYTVGATFTVTAGIAEDAANELTGTADAGVRLEFYGIDPADGVFKELRGRVESSKINEGNATSSFQTVSASYEFTAADEALGITQVRAVMGTDGSGHNSSTGIILFDDFVFEVDSDHVVTVAIPEPSSAVIVAGLLGLCGVRRKKS
jgi:hypothetical protein